RSGRSKFQYHVRFPGNRGVAMNPLSMNLKTLALILKGLRVSGSWSQCMRKKTERGLSMNRAVVGQASRLPQGRLAPGFVAGETPAKTAGTAAHYCPVPVHGPNARKVWRGGSPGT